MKLNISFSNIMLITAITVAIFTDLSLTTSKAYACHHNWLSRMDPTCPRSGGGSSDSSVGRDMTPPRVRTARELARQGYTCYEVNEYPAVVCPTPSGMNPAEFAVRAIPYRNLGGGGQWSWDCLNRGGQVWGRPNGQLLCQPDMR